MVFRKIQKIRNSGNRNHRKCQKAHSGIVSSRQGLGQARTLARRLYKKSSYTSKKDRGLSDHLVGFLCLKCLYQIHCDPMLPDTSPAVGIVFPL